MNPLSFFRAGTVYFILALVIFGGSAGYGVLKYTVYASQRQAIADNEQRLSNLLVSADLSEKKYRDFSSERSKKQTDLVKKINAILPPEENYTDLTRMLDEYFAEHDRPGNPIFQSSLRYGQGTPVPGMPGVNALPLSMNIEATRDNFFKFLDFIKNAGSLENGQRLLEIHSIQMNFTEGGEVLQDLRQKLNFSVEMSAYYRDVKSPR